MGSIHLLRDSDYPLPDRVYEAYAEAEAIIMEVDMDDLDPIGTQSAVAQLGMIQDGQTLPDLLGPENYAEAQELSEQLQLPLEMVSGAQPWFAAITVELMMIMRLGFDPNQGVEMHFTGLAGEDGKEITGFETEREQLEMLAGLPMDAQVEMFMQTLRQATKIEPLMDDMVQAWQTGDVDFMEEEILVPMRESRELHEVIVAARNLAWVDDIEALLDDDDDYLIIVGTLHMVGEEGVPELLRARGLEVNQLSR